MAVTRAGRPDLVFTNGIVRERIDGRAPADAIAIRNGVVLAVGGRGDVLAAAGEGAREVNLRGRTVLPAFTDSHTHFHRSSVLRKMFLDFETLRPATVDDVVEAVRQRADRVERGSWIQGDGLTARRLRESRLPNRNELDAAAPANPVLLRGIGKHVIAANSLALRLAGITRDTADPPGGRIERDDSGEPIGVLHERAKLRLDLSHPETVVPAVPLTDRLNALRDGVHELHRLGITTIHEMVREPQEAGDLAELRDTGQLDLRVRLYYRVYETVLSLDWLLDLGIRRGLGDDWYRILGIKVSADGFCIFQNAAVYEPYRHDQANRGLLRIEQADLDRLVARAHAAGLGIAIHAVGARAVDSALDAFQRAGPPGHLPHRIEHAYLDVEEGRLRRMRGLGLVWSTQPGFIYAYGGEWDEMFGVDRSDRIMPLRQALDMDIPLLLNSDVPCGPADPLRIIHAATLRRRPGSTHGRGETIPLTAAWNAVTSTPAVVTGEPRLGHLTAGARSDLVVFDDDPLGHRFDLETARVRATMIDGRFVFDEIGVGD